MLCISAICWVTWTVRNKVTFDAHVVRTTLEIVFTACSFLMYWTGLLKIEDRETLQGALQKVMQTAKVLAGQGARGGVLRIAHS